MGLQSRDAGMLSSG